jgi:uncharacterized protein YjeT (DUF2065 family)
VWHDLLVAMALLLVVEGILPFLSPDSLRRTLLKMADMDDRTLRVTGFISMCAGVALLYLVN